VTAVALTVRGFDDLPAARAEELLREVCSASRWAREVAAGRPYGGLAELQRAAAAALTDEDLEAALAGHPRIGDRSARGTARREQGAVATASSQVLDALTEGNRAYEERFGHVYLVCASGRDAEDLLATLRSRLDNDPTTERRVSLGELAAINRLRLERVFGS
jgi:2-oxo-4-hydroxy-4-carboxy-5-ureidoimidazoline decarboxylase